MRAPKATIERARGLRRALTLPEVLLWQALRRRQRDGFRFRRQHPIGPFLLDFYCADARLAVEIDGAAHDSPMRADHDARRDASVARQEIEVLRFMAVDVLDEVRRHDVDATIAARASERLAPSPALRAVPLPRDAGEDIPETL